MSNMKQTNLKRKTCKHDDIMNRGQRDKRPDTAKENLNTQTKQKIMKERDYVDYDYYNKQTKKKLESQSN